MKLTITVEHGSGFRWKCEFDESVTVLGIAVDNAGSMSTFDVNDSVPEFVEVMIRDFLDAGYELVACEYDGITMSEEVMDKIANEWQRDVV